MRELAGREARLTQMSTPTTMATPDPRSEIESVTEQHAQQLRTTVEQWTNRTTQLNEMMTYVDC
eukprot:1370935-Amphidinium_carterae.2